MFKSNDERVTDILIGEAMLDLLQSGKAVSSRALLESLQRMAENEEDDERRQGFARAIAEVKQNLAAQSDPARVTLRDRHNGEHHFKGEAVPGNKQKH